MSTSNRIPKCDCYEDCNGMWGKGNQDLCYGCCWSVGDKVKYTHDFGGSATVKWGRPSSQTNFCPLSASCGTYSIENNQKIELEYVCIGARGNYHFSESTDETWVSDPRLPQDIPFGNRGTMTGPTVGVNGTGWGVPPVIVIPKCDQFTDPDNVCCQPIPIEPYNETCTQVEYIVNPGHIPGCVQNWTWTYAPSYVAFVPKNDGQGYFWHPVKEVEPTTDEPNLGKIGGSQRSCCCGNQVDRLCECIQCYMDGCDPDRNLGLPQCERVCWPLKWNGSTDDPRLMMNDPADTGSCECEDSIEGRIRRIDDDTIVPCDCYNDETAQLWNDPCDPDPAPWPYTPSGIPAPDCPTCRRTGKLKHSAVIFALNLDGRDDIKYCSTSGQYWIEGQIRNKWTKYPVLPFLVMTCKPIWEWDCDCVDTDGEPYLKDEVCDGDGYQTCPREERKKKEVAGGYQWLLWNGNCEGPCKNCNIGRPQPCVYGCTFVENEKLFSGLVPQFTTTFEGKDYGPDWVPLGREPGIGPEAIAAGDFSVGCGNCSESISSCAGFKSYCVRRSFERPACPGECDGYYGLLWKEDSRCGDEGDPCKVAPSFSIPFAGCGYGVPSIAIGGGPLVDAYECCRPGPCQAQVYYATAGHRALCRPLFIQTLTIEPVESDERRCKWQEWQSFGKQKRCCGRSTNEDLIGKTKDVGFTPNIPVPGSTTIPGDYTFGWTEDQGPDAGGIGWPSRNRAQELCEKNTNICAPGDFDCQKEVPSCDCSLQPACGGTENFKPLGSPPTPRACALAPCNRAACNAGAPTCPYTPSTNPIWNIQGPITIGYPEGDEISEYKPEWEICYREEEQHWAFCDPISGDAVSWLLCEIETSDGIEWGYCPREAYDTYRIDPGGGNLSLGCNCFPPVCTSGCLDINTGKADPGFFDIPSDLGVCDPNNYRKYISELCIPNCQVCTSDVETCTYKGCPSLGDSIPPFCSTTSAECPCTGQFKCEDGECEPYYDCSSCKCPDDNPLCVLPTSGFSCGVPKGGEDCCVISSISCFTTTLVGRVLFDGSPIPGVEVLNNVNKNISYTDENGYFVLKIDISSDIKSLKSLEIFVLGFKNFVGFIGGISVFEKTINTDETRQIPYFFDLNQIELQEIPLTELSETYCVICEYECTTEIDCGQENKTCLSLLLNEKDLFLNCPFEKEFNCPNTNNSCLLTLKNASVVPCDRTDNPSFC